MARSRSGRRQDATLSRRRSGFRTPRRRPAIVARIRRLFDLDADVGAIAAHLAVGSAARAAGRGPARPAGAGGMGRLRAGRPGDARPADHRERRAPADRSACRIAWRATSSGCRRRRLGGCPPVFPPPERVAAADLTQLGMPRARATAISGLAAVAATDPDLFRRDGSLDASDRAPHGAAGSRRLDRPVRRDARVCGSRTPSPPRTSGCSGR